MAQPRAKQSRKARAGEPVVSGVRITHPDRVMFPEAGLTKLALARLADRLADWMLPHAIDRPLTLVRCPDGVPGGCFYMRHSHVWAPAALRRVRIQEKTKLGEYLVIESREALVALVQMNVVEIHTWNARFPDIERPDRLVLDLDPGPLVGFREVMDGARIVRDALEALGLASFVKTTGGRGLHVVVPIVPGPDWSECLDFARDLTEELARADPDRFTTSFAKNGRERLVLLDYLRNNRTNTSIAAYSVRARPGAPVSTPLRWEELTPRLKPDRFTALTIERRLARLQRDPWDEYWSTRQKLTAAQRRAVRRRFR